MEAEHIGGRLLRLHGAPLQFDHLKRLPLQHQRDQATVGTLLQQVVEVQREVARKPGLQQPIQPAAEQAQTGLPEQLLETAIAPEQTTGGVGDHQGITDLGQSQLQPGQAATQLPDQAAFGIGPRRAHASTGVPSGRGVSVAAKIQTSGRFSATMKCSDTRERPSAQSVFRRSGWARMVDCSVA